MLRIILQQFQRHLLPHGDPLRRNFGNRSSLASSAEPWSKGNKLNRNKTNKNENNKNKLLKTNRNKLMKTNKPNTVQY
jgi:hypothetical protein